MRSVAGHRYNIIYTILFVLIVIIPVSARISGKYRPPETSGRENRNLAKRPGFDPSLLDPYPKAFESWYNDHFFQREKMIDLNIWFRMNILDESPYPALVTIGREGWLYDANLEKKLYQGNLALPPDAYHLIMKELHLRTLWYRSKGIRFYVVVAPVKQEIYPEFLPAFYPRAHGGTMSDRIVNVLRKDTVIRLIILKDTLLPGKKIQRLYSMTDNHWNYIGGYVAYRQLMKEINKDFPGVKPLEREEFRFTEYQSKGGNLAEMIGMKGKLSETEWRPVFPDLRSVEDTSVNHRPDPFPSLNDSKVVRYIPGSDLPSIMVIRDSYSIHLFPYLSETFGRTCMFFDGWYYHLNAEAVEAVHPDIVVLEIFEPYLKNIYRYSLDCLAAENAKKK